MNKKAESKRAIGPKEFQPRIVAFVCNWCSGFQGDSLEDPGKSGKPSPSPSLSPSPSRVRIVNVMCSGRVTPGLVLKAFELGADGVMVCGCEKGACHYSFGHDRQAEMFETAKKLANLIGLEPERLRLDWLSPDGGEGLRKVVEEFVEHVTRVGPSPLRKSGGVG